MMPRLGSRGEGVMIPLSMVSDMKLWAAVKKIKSLGKMDAATSKSGVQMKTNS